MTDKPDSLFEKQVHRLKNRRFVVLLLLVCLCLSGAATLLKDSSELLSFFLRLRKDNAVAVVLPNDTGWTAKKGTAKKDGQKGSNLNVCGHRRQTRRAFERG